MVGTALMLGSAAAGVANTAVNAWQAEKNRQFNASEAEKNRQFNAEQSQIQRDYEERLSNTAIQRRYKDLEAAGINPILAATDGAQVPQGSAARSAAASYSGGNIGAFQGVQLRDRSQTRADLLAEIAATSKELSKFDDYTSEDGRRAAFNRSQLVKTIYNDSFNSAINDIYRGFK